MKSTAVLLILLFAGFTIGEDALLTKVFTVKFKRIDELATIVNGLLSEKGAITLQPSLKTIVVQDYEKNLRQVETAIAAYDVPPPSIEISVKLVRASKNPDPAPVSEEIKNMAHFSEVLKFNDYSLLDSAVVDSEEGQEAVMTLARDYQLNFVPNVVQEGNGIIRLKNFQLMKRKILGKGKPTFSPLLSVTLNLRNEETLVLGASRFEDSDQALLIILLAKVKK